MSFWSVAFHDATPTTLAASAPPGYCRDSRFSSAISGILLAHGARHVRVDERTSTT